ncbi:MAG: hypothetical protein COA86_17390 [Kangiella sp.]|nr:MAG: hypothetical protein COA86_17390 [Kangiella sp.]
MTILAILEISSTLALGLLVGSLLTEAMILVPYWRKMEPKEFLRLHGTMGPSLYRYFAPLTIAGTMLPMITGVISFVAHNFTLNASVVVALLTSLMFIIYFIYFKSANKSFESCSIDIEKISEELKRWASWHWLRVVIGLIAFSLSIIVSK